MKNSRAVIKQVKATEETAAKVGQLLNRVDELEAKLDAILGHLKPVPVSTPRRSTTRQKQ